MTAPDHDEHADIRDAVSKLCAQFPGEYWRKLDREMATQKPLSMRSPSPATFRC